jgi:mediator of RNA polymerase II transcription subunit 5
MGNKAYSTAFLRLTSAAALTEMLEEQYVAAFGAWFKALFDPNSEGIGDALLRSTQPKVMLRIAPLIIENAINAFLTKKMDQEALNNGISFFVGPLLNWTLVGVVRYLARDIQRKFYPVHVHWHVLYTFLSSNSCPKPVLWICGTQILQLFNHKRFQKDTPQMLSRRADASRRVKAANAKSKWDAPIDAAWREQPKAAIHAAVTMTRAGKAPMLDIARCVAVVSHTEFLNLLWDELIHTSSLGEMETCRRIVTTALIIPTPGPPLLPLFIHHVLPAAFAAVEQRSSEQAATAEHAVSIVSAALNALQQLERAYRLLHGQDLPILGESAASLARSFAAFLKSGKRGGSSICGLVASKLEALKAFTANFPLFVSELGSRS